ncbi:hypothetical protein Gpo141_00006184 [Globisporangium polare]
MVKLAMDPAQLPRLQDLRLASIEKEEVADLLPFEDPECPTSMESRDDINAKSNDKLLRPPTDRKLALLSTVRHVERALGTNTSMEPWISESVLEFAKDRRRIIVWNYARVSGAGFSALKS